MLPALLLRFAISAAAFIIDTACQCGIDRCREIRGIDIKLAEACGDGWDTMMALDVRASLKADCRQPIAVLTTPH